MCPVSRRRELGCVCKAFDFIPSRPEELGEFWLRRRKNFDPVAYRCNCRCKHTHVQHDAHTKRCLYRGCGCNHFDSFSVCAACDQHSEQHETRLETEAERKEDKRPIGEEWLPFAEISTLKKMVLHGVDDGGSMDKNAIISGQKAAAAIEAPQKKKSIVKINSDDDSVSLDATSS